MTRKSDASKQPGSSACVLTRTDHLMPGGGRIQFTVGVLILGLLFSQAVFASEYCQGNSAIDQLPFFVGQSYFDILDRAPDGASQKPRIMELADENTSFCKSTNPNLAGGNCEWNNNAKLVLEMLTSQESVSKHGGVSSNSEFVTALYRALLRRSPNTAETQPKVSVLNSGGSRVGLIASFLSSAEYRHRFACIAGAAYVPSCSGGEAVDPAPMFMDAIEKDILGRALSETEKGGRRDYVTSNELSMCANASGTAFSACDYIVEAQLTANLLNDPVYQTANPPISDNTAFITALYRHLLRRAPDAAGLEGQTKRLNDSNDRVGIVYSFLTSQEFRNRFSCYAGVRDHINLGFNGHPLTQAVYSNAGGVSFNDQLTKVQEGGALWYRFDVGVPSTGGDFRPMDSLVSTAQAHGVELLPVLIPSVDLAHDDVSSIYHKSYEGALNLVTHYKASIHVWELGNEEDIYSMHVAGDPGWPGGTPSGEHVTDYNPQKYAAVAAMLRGLADGVRAADGSALRIIDFAGWLHTGFLQHLENDRVPYDVVGIHWYQNYGEITCPGQALPCPSQLLHFNVVQRLRTITNGKPMWMTETNYTPVANDTEQQDLARRQKYLVPTLRTYMSLPSVYPFQMVMVYELLDEPNVRGGITQTKVGMFTVTAAPGGKFALGSAKPEYQSLRSLVGR